jgi:TonB family protein
MKLQRPSRAETPSGADRHDLDALLGKAFEAEPIWTRISASLRDILFAPKLPPLELTSTPIPVPDRMAGSTNRWAVGTATIVNGTLMLAIVLLGIRPRVYSDPAHDPQSNIDLSKLNDIAAAVARARGGSGGGNNALTDPTTGRPPRFERIPIVPPQVPVLQNPQLPIDSAIAVPIEIPVNQSMPVVGVQSRIRVSLDSGGPGRKAGIGTGQDGGDGPGDGPGSGPGPGNGIYVPGGDVSAPIPVVAPDAEFSDEARRIKYQGICLISVIVDAQGNPQNPRVIRHLGMGLDEKALEAVRRYKFKPARKNGRPVPVMITVEVNFRLY